MKPSTNPIAAIAKWVDQMQVLARQQSARRGQLVVLTCTKGCSACCSELVHASQFEADWILEGMTEAQIEELKPKLEAWLAKAEAAGLDMENAPDAITYRRLQMPCPLLKDGLCSVYARRPLACRTFMTDGPRRGCEDLSLREQQKYIDMPEVLHGMAALLVKAHVKEGIFSLEVGFLGHLLARRVLGLDPEVVTLNDPEEFRAVFGTPKAPKDPV